MVLDRLVQVDEDRPSERSVGVAGRPLPLTCSIPVA